MMALTAALIAAFSPAAIQDSPKAPAPDEASQKEAEKLIRDIFKEEYAKTAPADRLKLANEMIQQGLRTKDDAAARYVLFREARDLAAQAGDFETALRAIDEMDAGFRIEPLPMKSDVLSEAARGAKTADRQKRVAAACLELARGALQAEDLETATSAAASASSLARRAGELTLAVEAEAAAKEISGARAKLDGVRKARETLAKAPDDPSANLVVGQFLCLTKGDWAAGLPLLARGSDGDLRAAAEKDLADPADPSEQALVGDTWWDLAEKKTGVERANLRRRAAVWYRRAAPRLSGLSQTRVKKRLDELAPEELKDLGQELRRLDEQRRMLAAQLGAAQDEALRNDLRRRIDALDELRDETAARLRMLRRQQDDAGLRQEAKEIPADDRKVDELFKRYNEDHADRNYRSSIAGFKKLYYRFPDQRTGWISAYNVACGYALSGNPEEALDWLEIAIRAGYDRPADFDHMRKDSDLDSLRDEKRYLKLTSGR